MPLGRIVGLLGLVVERHETLSFESQELSRRTTVARTGFEPTRTWTAGRRAETTPTTSLPGRNICEKMVIFNGNHTKMNTIAGQKKKEKEIAGQNAHI